MNSNNINNERKALLPLIEILISTGIFAIAVVLTLQIFMLAKFLGDRNSDTADAILKVQYIAETIKAAKADEDMSAYLSNFESYVHLYYDINWNQTHNIDTAVYIIVLNSDKQEQGTGYLYEYDINLYKIEPYPFINDRIVRENPDYRPLLASITAAKFINNN